jgi:hypothetical protein
VPLNDEAEFLDRQGRVHARVSVDFVKEFGCYLSVPLPRRQRKAAVRVTSRPSRSSPASSAPDLTAPAAVPLAWPAEDLS